MSGSIIFVPVDSLLGAESVITVGFLSGVGADIGLMKRVGVACVFEKLERIVDCTGVPESLALRNRGGVPGCGSLRRPSSEISVSGEIGVQ